MGKVVMIVSLAVTAFMLIVTASTIYAYRKTTASAIPTQAAAQAAPALQMVAAPVVTNAISDVSPQEAASIAAKFLKRTDLYSVELADLQGAQTYKVTFSAGNIVFVGLQGQILSSVLPTPVPPIVVASGGGGGGHHRSGGGSGGSAGGGGAGGGEGETEGGGD